MAQWLCLQMGTMAFLDALTKNYERYFSRLWFLALGKKNGKVV